MTVRILTPKRRLEGIVVTLFLWMFAHLPLDAASAFGGKLARMIGPLTGIHRKARRNIIEILPDKSLHEVDHILTLMWDNLGRTVAEYPHLETIAKSRVIIDNQSGIDLKTLHNRPALFISGHFANWEIAAPVLYHTSGIALNVVYRPPNNPMVDRRLNIYRSFGGVMSTIPKSRQGMRTLIEVLKKNQAVGILIDQKYNEGVILPFFGKPATTSLAFAQLGQKMKCPIIPAQIVRTNGAHFHITAYPPLPLYDETGDNLPLEMIAQTANDMMGQWMKAHPEQWLWVHQRWSSAAVQHNEKTETSPDKQEEYV